MSYPLSYPGLKASITVRKSRVRDPTTHLKSPARDGKINTKLDRVDKTIWGISEHRLDAPPTLAASNSSSSCSGLRLLVSSHQHVRPSLCFYALKYARMSCPTRVTTTGARPLVLCVSKRHTGRTDNEKWHVFTVFVCVCNPVLLAMSHLFPISCFWARNVVLLTQSHLFFPSRACDKALAWIIESNTISTERRGMGQPAARCARVSPADITVLAAALGVGRLACRCL